MSSDIPKLRHRIESLPQELYDKIYDFTFTASAGARIIQQRSNRYRKGLGYLECVRTPADEPNIMALLLVDKTSHKQYVNSLYGGRSVVFVFLAPPACSIWLHRLKSEYAQMVKDVRCCVCNPIPRGYLRPFDFTWRVDANLLEKIWFGSQKMVLSDLKEFEGEMLEDWPENRQDEDSGTESEFSDSDEMTLADILW